MTPRPRAGRPRDSRAGHRCRSKSAAARAVDPPVHESPARPRNVGIDASDRYVDEARRRQPAPSSYVADIAEGMPISGTT